MLARIENEHSEKVHSCAVEIFQTSTAKAFYIDLKDYLYLICSVYFILFFFNIRIVGSTYEKCLQRPRTLH